MFGVVPFAPARPPAYPPCVCVCVSSARIVMTCWVEEKASGRRRTHRRPENRREQNTVVCARCGVVKTSLLPNGKKGVCRIGMDRRGGNSRRGDGAVKLEVITLRSSECHRLPRFFPAQQKTIETSERERKRLRNRERERESTMCV